MFSHTGALPPLVKADMPWEMWTRDRNKSILQEENESQRS